MYILIRYTVAASFVALLVVSPASGVSFHIEYGGQNNMNPLWNVMLSPDSASSVGTAIGMEFVGGEIVSITPNVSIFEDMLPSQNPFTQSITKGVSIHNVNSSNDGAFAGLGSVVLPDTNDVLVLTVETDALGTLSLGGQDHNGEFIGARVAQQGVNYDELTASLTVSADFNANGLIEANDFLIWQRGFGLTKQTDNSHGDADGNGIVDDTDLAIWQLQHAQGASTAISISTVPEPTSAAISVALLGASLVCRRLRRRGIETVVNRGR